MDPNTAILVENIKKRYRLGETVRHDALRDRLVHMANPLNWRSSDEPTANDETEFWALKGVSFEVKQGEVLGIIGHNGAGKSTLLKILSRITDPTEGRISLRGRIAALLEVGTGFHPELTGRENTYLNGSILGMTKAEVNAKFDQIVDFAGVEKFIDTPVKRYSSGMRVRLGFAIAAHLEPELLIIDEVLAVGDVAFQKRCIDQIRTAADSGVTVLFVSHQMNFVASLCDRVAVMSEGCIQSIGSVTAAIESYYSLLTPTQTGGKGGVLTDISVDHLAIEDGPTITTGSEVNLSLTYSGEETVTDFTCGFHFVNQEGVRVLSYPMACFSDEHFTVAPGTKIICRVHDFPCLPGQFRVLVGARGGQAIIEKPVARGVVNVVPDPDDAVTQRYRQGPHGQIVGRADWDLS